MNPVFSSMEDLRRANGWVIDTSVAVCLQTAGWTEVFLDMIRYDPGNRLLAIAPHAFLNGQTEADGEFTVQLATATLESWRLADRSIPGSISSALRNGELPAVREIIRASRRAGRAISRADAQGVYIAEQRNFALLTGDYLQARVAQGRNVTAIHKSTVLEMAAQDAGMPTPLLCGGLSQLIANSLPGHPCELSDEQRAGLQEIRRQRCPDCYNDSA